jgi:hypothetical protein
LVSLLCRQSISKQISVFTRSDGQLAQGEKQPDDYVRHVEDSSNSASDVA